MKIIKENSKFENVFPMRITCKQIRDKYGFTYGDAVDFCGSELEIEAEDIKKHGWEKYPNYSGTDYVVVCPICKSFIMIDEKLLPQKVKDNAESVRCRDYR
jgi:hypothetical protein